MDFLHKSIVKVARCFQFVALSGFPALTPPSNGLPAEGVFNDSGVFGPILFMDCGDEGNFRVQSSHVGLARKYEKVGALSTAVANHQNEEWSNDYSREHHFWITCD